LPASAALALAALLALAPPARAAPLELHVVPERTALVAHLLKAGIASRFAHEHVIVARAVAGRISLDPERPGTTSVSLTLFVDGLDADPPEVRAAYGLPPIGEKDRRKIAETMRSGDQLDLAHHRVIRFRSTRVTQVAGGRFRVDGELTLRGVTRPLALVVDARLEGRRLRATAHTALRQSDFGLRPYSALLGAVRVRDEVELDLSVEAGP